MTIQTYDLLQRWLTKTPLGREILHKERLFYVENVKTSFGLYSLQIGLNEINMLQGNKIVNHYSLPTDIIANTSFLPFKDDSIDLIIMPHYIEYINNPNETLQEIYRILSPNGKVILTTFNANSWLGIRKHKIAALKNMYFQNLPKFKDLIIENKFHIEAGKFFSYCPPSRSAKSLKNFSWMNKFGDRWFPTFANSFALILNKKISCNNVITPTLDNNSLNNPSEIANICNKN